VYVCMGAGAPTPASPLLCRPSTLSVRQSAHASLASVALMRMRARSADSPAVSPDLRQASEAAMPAALPPARAFPRSRSLELGLGSLEGCVEIQALSSDEEQPARPQSKKDQSSATRSASGAALSVSAGGRGISSSCTGSRFRGVSRYRGSADGRWAVRLWGASLGVFSDEETAARRYDESAWETGKDELNFPQEYAARAKAAGRRAPRAATRSTNLSLPPTPPSAARASHSAQVLQPSADALRSSVSRKRRIPSRYAESVLGPGLCVVLPHDRAAVGPSVASAERPRAAFRPEASGLTTECALCHRQRKSTRECRQALGHRGPNWDHLYRGGLEEEGSSDEDDKEPRPKRRCPGGAGANLVVLDTEWIGGLPVHSLGPITNDLLSDSASDESTCDSESEADVDDFRLVCRSRRTRQHVKKRKKRRTVNAGGVSSGSSELSPPFASSWI
jgi:hypothetical protein